MYWWCGWVLTDGSSAEEAPIFNESSLLFGMRSNVYTFVNGTWDKRYVVNRPTIPCPNTAIYLVCEQWIFGFTEVTLSPTKGLPSCTKLMDVSTFGKKTASSGEISSGTSWSFSFDWISKEVKWVHTQGCIKAWFMRMKREDYLTFFDLFHFASNCHHFS